jgi:hypothetical protein
MISRNVLAIPKRKSIFVLLAMPVAVFLWYIGWGLYWIAAEKEKLKPEAAKQKENVMIGMILPEEKIKA